MQILNNFNNSFRSNLARHEESFAVFHFFRQIFVRNGNMKFGLFTSKIFLNSLKIFANSLKLFFFKSLKKCVLGEQWNLFKINLTH